MRNLRTQSVLKLRDNMDAIVTPAALEDFVRANVVFITDVNNAVFISLVDDDKHNMFRVTHTIEQKSCLDCCDATDDLSTLTDEPCETHTQTEDVWYDYVDMYYHA
jgi:hypothetical protein